MQPTNEAAQKTIQTKKYFAIRQVEMRTTTAYLNSVYKPHNHLTFSFDWNGGRDGVNTKADNCAFHFHLSKLENHRPI